MNPENPKLNITPKPEKILRDKHEKIERAKIENDKNCSYFIHLCFCYWLTF